MKTLNMRINKTWDNEDDLWYFKLIVPEDIATETVNETILSRYNELSHVGTEGVSPVELMDDICETYDWKWEDFDYDIDVNLA